MPDVSLGLAGSFSHGRVITQLSSVTSPAVGVPLTIKVNSEYWERPRALTLVLTADAADSISDVNIQYLDYDGVAFMSADTGPALTAGTSATYSFLSDWTGASAWSGNIVNASLPPLFLQGGYSIVVTPTGTFTLGQITAVRWMRERFITGPQGYEIGYQDDEGRRENLLQLLADHLA